MSSYFWRHFVVERFLMALAVARGAVAVLAFAVVTMAIFTFHGSITVLLAVAFLAISSTMDMTLFTLAVVARAIGTFHDASRSMSFVTTRFRT